jgi:hypothetical protein
VTQSFDLYQPGHNRKVVPDNTTPQLHHKIGGYRWGSNPRHPHCKCGALPSELLTHIAFAAVCSSVSSSFLLSDWTVRCSRSLHNRRGKMLSLTTPFQQNWSRRKDLNLRHLSSKPSTLPTELRRDNLVVVVGLEPTMYHCAGLQPVPFAATVKQP